MRVLLVATDLYLRIGGGETVYRKIIESTPDVHFCYLLNEETPEAVRPSNTTAVKLARGHRLDPGFPPPFPDYRYKALVRADQIARSVAGMSFDVVDVADFHCFGNMLRAAFEHHHVDVKKIVLALHGTISNSMEEQWQNDGCGVLSERILEKEQFVAVDYVYAISERYANEWRAQIDREVHIVDPVHFMNGSGTAAEVGANWKSDVKPSLYFIGRTERVKGPDLFVELVRWIDRSLYDRVEHIGGEVTSVKGVGSRLLLEGLASNRNIRVDFMGPRGREELMNIFSQKSIIILPARYDSFNLVALEAIAMGCPVAVSTNTGVCQFLDKHYPALPYIKIDMKNFYGCVDQIEAVLKNYDAYRQKLLDILQQSPVQPKSPLQMKALYEAALGTPERTICATKITYTTLKGGVTRYALGKLIDGDLWDAIGRRFVYMRRFVTEGRGGNLARKAFAVGRILNVRRALIHVMRQGDDTHEKVLDKLRVAYNYCRYVIYRCNFWQDIARLEDAINHPMHSATYHLRLLRLLGGDRLGTLPKTIDALQQAGYAQEARAAESIYADPALSAARVYDYLIAARQRNMHKPDLPLYKTDDRREGQPRVSIIVSLYKAASKLDFFLTCQNLQTLIQKDRTAVEFILVDSGSPTDEYEVLCKYWQTHGLNALYVRSAERETIQSAWNRGIKLVKAPYLVFLGVDEFLFPDALEKMVAVLDAKPDSDWVMSSSLVTEVDPYGLLKQDVMTYDRGNAYKNLAYLESCYVAYVGSMYRKSIHDRFGYYDETFRGAGDTEFKNRVMPFVKVEFMPETLGLFQNYPEERMTSSPLAEIEDLRAWYIHRTPGGVRYAFENAPTEEIEKLLMQALGYRKSYCRHQSSDVDYAVFLVDYLLERQPGRADLVDLRRDLYTMRDMLRALELSLRLPSRYGGLQRLLRTKSRFRQMQKRHAELFPGKAQPAYHIFNDNRYEQHSWLWKSA